ncbi:phosphoglycerol transferase MdoB-like AlkP superfamily enzyme [Okibacterium sp. HSC-33S16]|uniref:hypothetical protein n=1 Tax=Okibacterium sp. HSC-33S16 TaxID=2910965 RepID=UPI00209ECAAD|nr:hypothetical protein [Okibacterium sp. HSC-33S16]MCP2032689.1 phosphoglycerol transferase MdoB-like AlkP superfamily enzyme [Okibacterium sp. HSC-33S16]
MPAQAAVTTSRLMQIILAWAIGIIGVLATLASIAPSLFVAFSYLSPLTGAVLALVLVEVSIPVFLGLAVANVRGRWWLWLLLAVVLVLVVGVLSPAFGSLGVFWMQL